MELIGYEAELKYDIITVNNQPDDSDKKEEEYDYIPYDLLTPSEIAGMTQREEKSIRCFLMSLIQEIGVILKINQSTILTAMNIANHYYLKQPFNLFEPIYIISASVFIAGKIEENIKKPSDLLSASIYLINLKQRQGQSQIQKHRTNEAYTYDDICIDYSNLKSFSKMKDNIYNAELVIMKELAYDLHPLTFHPQCLLLHYIKKISDDANLLKHSWGFVNDMYRTSLTANYPPNVISCSAIFIASRKYYISLPKDVPWWELFETSIEQIEEVIAETMKLYEYYSDFELEDVRRVFRRLKEDKERETNRKSYKDDHHRDRHRHRQSKHHSDHRHSKHHSSHSYHRHSHRDKRSRSRHRSKSRNRHRDTSKHYKNDKSASSSPLSVVPSIRSAS